MKTISENRIKEMATERGIYEDQGRNWNYYYLIEGIRAAIKELGEQPTGQDKRSLIESILMRYYTDDDYGIEETINALCLLTTVPTEEEIDDKSYRQQCDEQEMEGSYHELDD